VLAHHFFRDGQQIDMGWMGVGHSRQDRNVRAYSAKRQREEPDKSDPPTDFLGDSVSVLGRVLFGDHRLYQVSGVVYVVAFLGRYVVGKQLQGNHFDDGQK